MKNTFVIATLSLCQILIAVLFLIGTQAQAESVQKNFRIRDTKRAELKVSDIRKRFKLSTQIVVSDSTGRLLYFGNLGSSYGFDKDGDLTVFEMSREPGIPPLALKMAFALSKDGNISLNVQQFQSMEPDPAGDGPKLGKLIREDKFAIKDFAPVDWLAFNTDGKRVVVRITPQLGDEEEEPIDVQAAALSFQDGVMFDNKGFFWARTDGRLEGRYLSVRSHMGQAVMSFVPFKGAKEIGVAEGNQVTLNGPDMKIYIRSAAPVVIGSRPAKIYGIIDLEKRTAKANAVHVQSGDREKEFLRDL